MTKAKQKADLEFDSIDYPYTPEQLDTLSAKYDNLTSIASQEEYEIVMEALADLRAHRLEVESKRAALKKKSLEHGKNVDKVAKSLQTHIAPAEERLKAVRQVEDDRRQAIADAVAKADKDRIDGHKRLIEIIVLTPNTTDNTKKEDLEAAIATIENTEFDTFEEFELEARGAASVAIQQVTGMLTALAEREAQEAARVKLAADQKKLADDKKIQDDALAAKKKEQDDELAEAKQKVDDERKKQADELEEARQKLADDQAALDAEKEAMKPEPTPEPGSDLVDTLEGVTSGPSGPNAAEVHARRLEGQYVGDDENIDLDELTPPQDETYMIGDHELAEYENGGIRVPVFSATNESRWMNTFEMAGYARWLLATVRQIDGIE